MDYAFYPFGANWWSSGTRNRFNQRYWTILQRSIHTKYNLGIRILPLVYWILTKSCTLHRVLEEIPLVPNIKIHVTEVNGFVQETLNKLGLGQNELITGNVYADLMYMPAGVTCGTPSWFPTQLQSLLFRQTMTWSPEPRRSIILIKRTTRRYFYCHDYILNMLNKVSIV